MEPLESVDTNAIRNKHFNFKNVLQSSANDSAKKVVDTADGQQTVLRTAHYRPTIDSEVQV